MVLQGWRPVLAVLRGVNEMKKLLTLSAAAIIAHSANAELQALDDVEMSSQSGAGLGFALQDFVFSTDDASLAVTGIEDGTGNEVGIKWDQFYIMGEGSQNGAVKKPVDIGSYLHPWVVRSVRGSSDWDGDPADFYTGDAPAIGDDVQQVAEHPGIGVAAQPIVAADQIGRLELQADFARLASGNQQQVIDQPSGMERGIA